MSAKKQSQVADEYLENPEDISIDAASPGTDPHAEQDDIFVRGLTGGTFRGKPLAPLCFMRRRAANALGVRFGSLSADEVSALQNTGFYQGIDTDVVLVLFLLSISKVEVIKALRLPEQYFEKALKWGEANNLEPGTAEFESGAAYMFDEFVSLAKARGEYKPAEGKAPKNKKRGN